MVQVGWQLCIRFETPRLIEAPAGRRPVSAASRNVTAIRIGAAWSRCYPSSGRRDFSR